MEFDMSTQAGLVTVEEYLKLPEPKGGHYELHHGEVVLVPPPKWEHEEMQDRIQVLLKRLAPEGSRVRMEMSFRPAAEYEVWRADVGLLTLGRALTTKPDEYLAGAPDLVVEVLSPGNTADEINDKMAICLENGCASFWVVDLKHQRLAVTEGDVTRHYKAADSFACDVLGATISVRDIFA
jgi:Uma2 family endonuclease